MEVSPDQRCGIHARQNRRLTGGALREPLDAEVRVGHGHPTIEGELRLFVFEVGEKLGINPIKRIVWAASADSHSVYKDQ